MSKPISQAVIIALLSVSLPAFAEDGADLTPFPAAEDGALRYAITLPEEADEADLRVEVIAGKTLEADCNIIMMGGQLTRETVEGWGYDYLVIEEVSEPASTMMACPDDQKTERFVPVNLGDAAMQAYNSKLPIVVYTPSDLAVKYRIWRADAEFLDAVVE